MSSVEQKRSKLQRLGIYFTVALLGAAIAARLGMAAVAWWIDCNDEPSKSDILVVLAGNYTRFPYAADLYAQGYAPAVWISRPIRSPAEILLERIGTRLPTELSVNKDILLKCNVPEERIRLFGSDVSSTLEEALALRQEYASLGRKILIVTSRFHARRARMIFRHYLPEAEIRVTATPYERFTRRWWTDKELAQNTILETTKLAYYLSGGRFHSQPLEKKF